MIERPALALAVVLVLVACDTTPVEQPKPYRPPTTHTHGCYTPSGVFARIKHIHGTDEGFSLRMIQYSIEESDARSPDRPTAEENAECLDHAYPDWREHPGIAPHRWQRPP